MLQTRYDIWVVQELLGHSDVGRGVLDPLDAL
jgi:site-specific recombinase XerD